MVGAPTTRTSSMLLTRGSFAAATRTMARMLASSPPIGMEVAAGSTTGRAPRSSPRLACSSLNHRPIACRLGRWLRHEKHSGHTVHAWVNVSCRKTFWYIQIIVICRRLCSCGTNYKKSACWVSSFGEHPACYHGDRNNLSKSKISQ